MTLQIICGIVLGLLVSFPFLALALGKINGFWSITKEGTSKIVVRAGKYKKTLFSYDGFYPKGGEDITPQVDGKPANPSWQKYTGGLQWIGIWPFDKVYKYNFRWRTIERTTDEAGKTIKKVNQHEEILDYVYLKASTYYARLESIPIAGQFTVNLGIILAVRIINPRKALMRAHQWYEFMIDMLMPHVRQFCADKEFEDLKKSGQLQSDEMYTFLESDKPLTDVQKTQVRNLLLAEGKTEKEITKELNIRNVGVIAILRQVYGINIMEVKIDDVDTADPRYQQALSKKKEAELEAERIDLINEALKKNKDQALFNKYMETLETVSKGPGNLIIAPGFESIFKEVLGALNKTTPK